MCWLLMVVCIDSFILRYSVVYANDIYTYTYEIVVVEMCVQLKLFFPPTLLWHSLSCDIPHTSHIQTILPYIYRRYNPQSVLKTTDNLFQ